MAQTRVVSYLQVFDDGTILIIIRWVLIAHWGLCDLPVAGGCRFFALAHPQIKLTAFTVGSICLFVNIFGIN